MDQKFQSPWQLAFLNLHSYIEKCENFVLKCLPKFESNTDTVIALDARKQ